MNLSFAGTLSYQAPGGSTVNTSLAIGQATYSAQQAGSIDVPSGTASGAYPIQFGAVATPIGLIVKSVSCAGAVYFNGQTGGPGVPVQTGGIVAVMNQAPGPGPGLTSAVFVPKLTQILGQVDFLVFGD